MRNIVKKFFMQEPVKFSFAVAGVILLIVAVLISPKNGNKKYTIQTKHAIYHTDSFRLYGKGIVFDEDHRQVIVMGDFDITSKLQN